MITDIEKLENMPIKENRAQYLTRKYNNMYNTNISRRSWHTVSERNPYKITERLLSHYVGKKFDDFFSDWSERCKHLDILRENKYFFERLIARNKNVITCFFYKYYIDDSGIIRRNRVYRKRRRKKQKKITPKEWYEIQALRKKEERDKEEKVYDFKPKKEVDLGI